MGHLTLLDGAPCNQSRCRLRAAPRTLFRGRLAQQEAAGLRSRLRQGCCDDAALAQGVFGEFGRLKVQRCHGRYIQRDSDWCEVPYVRIVHLGPVAAVQVHAQHVSKEVVPYDGNLFTWFGHGQELRDRPDRGSDLLHDFTAKGRVKTRITGLDTPADGLVVVARTWPSSTQEYQMLTIEQNRANIAPDPHTRNDIGRPLEGT